VKAIRAGRAQIKEAYVVVKDGEILMIGAHITPLISASTHVKADPTRTRKLLLHRSEINRLVGQVERAGYTLVPLNLHYTRGRVKLDLGLAKGEEAIRQEGDDQGAGVETASSSGCYEVGDDALDTVGADALGGVGDDALGGVGADASGEVGDELVGGSDAAAGRRFERRGKFPVAVIAGDVDRVADATSRRT
jgi:hypothetical protein